MDNDYVLKYTAQFTPEGLDAHKKNPWPEGFNLFILNGDPSELEEYKLLKSNASFWQKIEKEGLQKYKIPQESCNYFKDALLKEMSRMMFSKNHMEFFSGGNFRQLEPIRNKLKDLKISPFFKSHLISAIYQHLNQDSSKDKILNFDQAENIADFFENILPLAVKASNDALVFVADTKNAKNRKNVQHGDIKLCFAKSLAHIYQKHLNEKPVSSDHGLYIFLYAEACKVCGFEHPNIKIAKDAIADMAKRLKK